LHRVVTDDSVSYRDGDANTCLWSEINPNCSAVQIDIVMIPETDDGSAGPSIKYLQESILTDPEEGLRDYHTVENAAQLADCVDWQTEGRLILYPRGN